MTRTVMRNRQVYTVSVRAMISITRQDLKLTWGWHMKTTSTTENFGRGRGWGKGGEGEGKHAMSLYCKRYRIDLHPSSSSSSSVLRVHTQGVKLDYSGTYTEDNRIVV